MLMQELFPGMRELREPLFRAVGRRKSRICALFSMRGLEKPAQLRDRRELRLYRLLSKCHNLLTKCAAQRLSTITEQDRF
jgi:hypothetical protein